MSCCSPFQPEQFCDLCAKELPCFFCEEVEAVAVQVFS